ELSVRRYPLSYRRTESSQMSGRKLGLESLHRFANFAVECAFQCPAITLGEKIVLNRNTEDSIPSGIHRDLLFGNVVVFFFHKGKSLYCFLNGFAIVNFKRYLPPWRAISHNL